MPGLIDYFRGKGIEALGIGSCGPLSLDPNAPDYGAITTTPKLAWRDYPLRRAFAEALGVPVGIDTDVNAAALGEAVYGAGQGLDSLVYYTIGTGVAGASRPRSFRRITSRGTSRPNTSPRCAPTPSSSSPRSGSCWAAA